MESIAQPTVTTSAPEYLLDLTMFDVDAIVAVVKQGEWKPEWARLAGTDMARHMAVKSVLDFGASCLRPGMWLARRVNNIWKAWARSGVPAPDTLAISRTIAMLAALRVQCRVSWSQRDGFHPRCGALGLLKPAGDYTLHWPDGAIRRIVIGTQTPFGTGAWLFDNLETDENGNPHPVGLYLLRGN